jgi:hypothetical protein
VWSYPAEGSTKVPNIPGSESQEPSQPSWNLRDGSRPEGDEERRESEPAPFAPLVLPSEDGPTCDGCHKELQDYYAKAGMTRHPYCEKTRP